MTFRSMGEAPRRFKAWLAPEPVEAFTLVAAYMCLTRYCDGLCLASVTTGSVSNLTVSLKLKFIPAFVCCIKLFLMP